MNALDFFPPFLLKSWRKSAKTWMFYNFKDSFILISHLIYIALSPSPGLDKYAHTQHFLKCFFFFYHSTVEGSNLIVRSHALIQYSSAGISGCKINDWFILKGLADPSQNPLRQIASFQTKNKIRFREGGAGPFNARAVIHFYSNGTYTGTCMRHMI